MSCTTFLESFELLGICIPQSEVSLSNLIQSNLCLNLYLIEHDSRIFVQDGDSWSLKGRYSTALRLREPLLWEIDEDTNKYSVSIAAVSLIFFQPKYTFKTNYKENEVAPLALLAPAPVISLPPTTQSTTSPNQHSGGRTRPSANNPFCDNLMAALDIPATLAERPKGNVDVRIAWGKYKGIQAAQSLYYHMKNDRTWTLPLVTADDIYELFVSKTVYHRNYKKSFPRARKFSVLESWLDQEEDAVMDDDLWDEVKSVYTFADLDRLLDKLEKKKVKKGKRKAEDEGVEKSHKKKKASRST